MNSLQAKVTTLESMENLALVSFSMGEQKLQMVSLGLPKSIKKGSDVLLGVKATNISIAKNLSGIISTSNQLKARVETLSNGKLLSTIQLRVEDTLLESIITSEASLLLNLQEGDAVMVLIKASDLSLLKLC